MQEAIGVAGTLLFAKWAGLQPSSFSAAPRGIDFLMTTPAPGMYAVVEAKGGTSRWNNSTGGQMSATWIESRIQRAIDGGQVDEADEARLRVEKNTGPIFAAIVATNFKSKTGAYVAIRVNLQRPESQLGMELNFWMMND